MIYILFSLLIGSIISLFLVSPQIYYPFLIILIVIGTGLIFLFKSNFKKPNKLILLSLPLFILSSYFLTSVLMFKPKNTNLIEVSTSSLLNDKKAIILYANGEMEDYIPYYAKDILENKPYIVKPIDSYKLKKAYKSIESSEKNINIAKIARDFRESLLNHSPSYFYLSYSNYTPNIKESVNLALKDGCKDITIINFSNNKNDKELLSIEKELTPYNINLKISEPILNKVSNDFLLKDVPTDLSKFNNVVILSDNTKLVDLKPELSKRGVNESNIYLTDDVNKEINKLKDNVLIINLIDFSNGLLEKHTIPKVLDTINYKIISPFKYDKDFLEILVNEYKTVKNLS